MRVLHNKSHVPEIPSKGNPGRLRAKMPVDSGAKNDLEDLEVVGYVTFSSQGIKSLSGISLQPASEDSTDFYEGEHRYIRVDMQLLMYFQGSYRCVQSNFIYLGLEFDMQKKNASVFWLQNALAVLPICLTGLMDLLCSTT
ncbi:hypothetical protein POM88_016522 [Heracleum sosnowskyi]|uniref:Uncharacterized protein n=1 Tax=Heracleum sosnowskyi TaxID=360622 RepID=A0AAD8ILV7_9APIA|nr:hypothetical protein POM88_016522 [Heracleum sosnowskyi]